MKIAFNMLIFCGNLVKQFVDSLEESSLYFLKDKKSTNAKNRVLLAILKALKKNQTSMGPIAIRICYLIYFYFVRTSAHLQRKTFNCLTHVVLFVLRRGLVCF